MPDELSKPNHVHRMLGGLSPAVRRVSMKRFEKYWRDYYPDDTKLKTLLDLWASQGLVVQATDGYTLEPDMHKAIEEGLIPVVLAGDFLHRLTQDGFLWVPGVKYQRERHQSRPRYHGCLRRRLGSRRVQGNGGSAEDRTQLGGGASGSNSRS